MPATISDRAGSTILVVDDDKGVTDTFSRMLELEGFKVQTAPNAEVGLKRAETATPDAIIVDLRMPLVDGLGFLRRLRANDQLRATPVAIVTGDYFLDEALLTELRELGAQVKFKPLWLDDLVTLALDLLVSKVIH